MRPHVSITTGSRLHFGPLAVGATVGRQFGGVGVMIDSPGVALSVSRQERDEIIAPAALLSRIQKTVARWRDYSQFRLPVKITLTESIPGHQGLGSGTQLAMALAKAMSELQADAEPSVETLAKAVRRGQRSAIGIHGFEHGGFLIDAGKKHTEEIGVLAARCEVPSAWRILLVTPRHQSGLSGDGEVNAFATMDPMPVMLRDRLCRIVLTDLLPAVRKAEFVEFATALEEFGNAVGEFFAPYQGGGFAHPAMSALAASLRKDGIAGPVQSSWGPTVAVWQSDSESAAALSDRLARESRFGELTCRVVAPLNRGATVEYGEGRA